MCARVSRGYHEWQQPPELTGVTPKARTALLPALPPPRGQSDPGDEAHLRSDPEMTEFISPRGQVPPITHSVPSETPQGCHRAGPVTRALFQLPPLGAGRVEMEKHILLGKSENSFSFCILCHRFQGHGRHTSSHARATTLPASLRGGDAAPSPSTKGVPAQGMEDALLRVTLLQDKDIEPDPHIPRRADSLGAISPAPLPCHNHGWWKPGTPRQPLENLLTSKILLST